uniref:Uncharacterized protein n=1 Tax=Rhizophora mucronata TaxID=61149 RepID=A0A2P2NS94_RHIMU
MMPFALTMLLCNKCFTQSTMDFYVP